MIIAGPAYIVKQTGAKTSATFKSETDITVSIEKETKERKASHLGKFDEVLLSVKAEIKFKPIEWDNLDVLFPWTSMSLGQAVFGDTDLKTEIYSADGKKYTFHRTAITASPSIGAGVEKDLMGEATITALIGSTKSFADGDSIYKVETATFNPPALDEDKIFSIPFKVSYGSVELEAEEGVDIEFNVTTTERKTDRVGIFDYIFGGYEATAKFKPTNITEAQYNSIANPNGGVARGRSLRSQGENLVIKGDVDGDPMFTLTKAVCAGSQTLNFSTTENRFGELEFRATSTQYNTPKLTIGTVEGVAVSSTGGSTKGVVSSDGEVPTVNK